MTDPYRPVERRLRLVRRCLEVLAEFRNPVVVIIRNHRVTRDADLLGEGAFADEIRSRFQIACRTAGMPDIPEHGRMGPRIDRRSRS